MAATQWEWNVIDAGEPSRQCLPLTVSMGLMWYRRKVHILSCRDNVYRIGQGCYRQCLRVMIGILNIIWAVRLRLRAGQGEGGF